MSRFAALSSWTPSPLSCHHLLTGTGPGELPCVADDDLQVDVFRLPAELVAGAVARRHKRGWIAGAAVLDLGGNGVTGDLPAGLDDLSNREPCATAEVVDAVAAGLGVFEGEQVCLGEVGDVDVVADAGAVGGRVVLAVDVDRRALTEGDLQDQRDEVGLGRVALTEAAPRAGDVEVPQAHGTQSVRLCVRGDG